MGVVPRNNVSVRKVAAENIKGAANGEIEPVVSFVVQELNIFYIPNTACVGHGNTVIVSEQCNQRLLNALFLPLCIHTVHQIFCTVIGKSAQRLCVYSHVCPFLPAVGGNK